MALALLEQQAVWLVLTDLRMPRLGGLDLLREVKRNGWAVVPVGDLTAVRDFLHVDDVDEEAAIRTARLAAARGMLVTSDLDRVTERTTALVASVSIPIFAEHVPPQITGEAKSHIWTKNGTM